MGSFYLDIIKDRQYTTRADSIARRSAQTAMYLIVEALVRWLAPIVSFTAEEVWKHIPGERGDSVFLESWFDLPEMFTGRDDIAGQYDMPFWNQVVAVRDVVSKRLEQLRVAGGIGSSLDAEVDLYCGREIHDLLMRLGDELRFVLITSAARVHLVQEPPAGTEHFTLDNGDELWVVVAPSDYVKCTRCWHHRADVGSHPDHPEICGRCVENVTGPGEKRRYA